MALLCLSFAKLRAAEYQFDVWTAENGLPQNVVRGIVQTRDGYLWVGTLDGLARFDGVRFTVYNKANSPGLLANRITRLYEDQDGVLWIGLDDGSVARFHQGTFQTFGVRDGLPGDPVSCITGDREGRLWVMAGHRLLNLDNGRFRPGLTEEDAAILPRPIHDGNHILWSTNRAGLHVVSNGNVLTWPWTGPLADIWIHHMDRDEHGTFWIATEDSGLLRIQGDAVRVISQREGLPRNLVRPAFGPTAPALACEDGDGNLWVTGVGPWLGRLKEGVFTPYPNERTASSHPLPTSLMEAGHINILFVDRENNLWIGTEGSGLIRARRQAVEVVATRDGLPSPNVYPVCEDRSGALWAGTWIRGLSRLEAGTVTAVEGFNLVTALHEDRQGRLWVGMIGRIGLLDQGMDRSSDVPTGLKRSTVSAILQDRSGTYWFGADRGLLRLREGQLDHFTSTNGLAGDRVFTLIEDHQGAIWVGSIGGITRIAEDVFQTWTEADGLPSNHVRALYEDADGVLWIGTYDGGLGRFREGRFTRFTTASGLFDNGVFQILEDSRGRFWMSSNRGIHRVNKQDLNAFAAGRLRSIEGTAYGRSDGMLNPECNGGRWPAGVKTRDGRLWFPTQNGLAVVDPESLPANPEPPPVVIEAAVLDRKSTSVNGPIVVPPGTANLEVQYTALSLINSERIRFRYRLEGWDNDWVEAGRRRVAYYSRLRPGRYVFRVLAANSDGIWNEVGASLPIRMLPAWWETLEFRTTLGMGLAALLLAVTQSRVRHSEQQRRQQERFARQLLESQETERRRMASELHDGLGQNLVLIKNLAMLPADERSSGPTGNHPDPQIISAAERAIEEMHAISYALRPPELDRLGLSRALRGMVRRASLASGIPMEAHIECSGSLPAGWDIQVFRIAQEAVNNLVRHAQATEARVELWEDTEGLHLVVADDGCGFEAGAMGRGRRRGLGLAGIEERAKLLGAACRWLSNPGRGTTLSLLIPPWPEADVPPTP